MNKDFIEFKKQRDFGSILSDTFAFIRTEFKPFLKTVLSISAPAIVFFLIATGFYLYSVGNIFDFGSLSNSPTAGTNNVMLIILALFVFAISAIVAYVFTGSSALHYIKAYMDNKGEVNLEDVKSNVYKNFSGYLGLGFLMWVTLIVAVLLCVLPLFYAMVPMFVVFCIYIFETNRSSTDSYGYSFKLVNEDFWVALGIIVVFGILISIIGQVFSIPAVIYTYAKMGIFSGEVDPANMDVFKDPIYILLNILSTLFQLLLNLILVVASALLYFHLNEKKNFTGTYERISNIGKTED